MRRDIFRIKLIYQIQKKHEKAPTGLKDEEKRIKITTKEEKRTDLTKGVGKEHIYESSKNIERTRMKKPPC